MAKSSKPGERTIKPPARTGKVSMAQAKLAVAHVFARKSGAASALASGKRSVGTPKNAK